MVPLVCLQCGRTRGLGACDRCRATHRRDATTALRRSYSQFFGKKVLMPIGAIRVDWTFRTPDERQRFIDWPAKQASATDATAWRHLLRAALGEATP